MVFVLGDRDGGSGVRMVWKSCGSGRLTDGLLVLCGFVLTPCELAPNSSKARAASGELALNVAPCIGAKPPLRSRARRGKVWSTRLLLFREVSIRTPYGMILSSLC